MPRVLDSCLLCDQPSRQFQPYAVVKDWRYVRCGTCSFVFLDPQPTEAELGDFYDHSYQYDLGRYESSLSRQQIWLEMVEQLCGDRGDLLEIGCSYGHFLRAARDRGWNVQGLELGVDAAGYARDRLSLPVQKGRIADLRDTGKSFDAIVAWHVLEHDPLPRAFVETAFELLRPGGILALRVPNLDSTVASLAGPCWQWLSPPEHVCMYTLKTLSRLLGEAGFEIVAKKTARGNARNMWFETGRARMKQLISNRNNGRESVQKDARFNPPTVYQDRLWYRSAENLLTAFTWPLDRICSPWMAKRDSDAELALFARKPAEDCKEGPASAHHSNGGAS